MPGDGTTDPDGSVPWFGLVAGCNAATTGIAGVDSVEAAGMLQQTNVG